MQTIENEIQTLKDDRKELIDEFSTKLDLKILTAALKVAKIESTIDRKDTFDVFMEVLKEN